LPFPALTEKFTEIFQALICIQQALVIHIGANPDPAKSTLAGAFADTTAQPDGL
jgi:hypothetical protein